MAGLQLEVEDDSTGPMAGKSSDRLAKGEIQYKGVDSHAFANRALGSPSCMHSSKALVFIFTDA